MQAANARFDWYQSTVMVQCPQDSGLVDALLKAWPLSDWAPARNRNGYTRAGAIVRGERLLCHVGWGGQPGVNCTSTSDESPTLAKALRDFGRLHRPVRIDSCLDWVEEGLFDSMSAFLIEHAKAKRLAIDQRGDWTRGEARTLYVGSKDSPVRLVLYEKGYEQGGDAPRDWVRLEVRVRPKRQHREMVARWDPPQVFSVGWVHEALAKMGWDDLQARSVVGTVWRRDDEARARAALVRQYGAILARWADEVGDWDSLGGAIRAEIEALA